MNVRQLWKVVGEIHNGSGSFRPERLLVARDFDEASAFAPDALCSGFGSDARVNEITRLELVEDRVVVPPAGKVVHGADY